MVRKLNMMHHLVDNFCNKCFLFFLPLGNKGGSASSTVDKGYNFDYSGRNKMVSTSSLNFKIPKKESIQQPKDSILSLLEKTKPSTSKPDKKVSFVSKDSPIPKSKVLNGVDPVAPGSLPKRNEAFGINMSIEVSKRMLELENYLKGKHSMEHGKFFLAASL